MVTPYNPNDPLQASFLNALALGEVGPDGGNPFEGFGGVNLAGAPTNQFGFPQWNGAVTSAGPTHAAGLFQFEPGTWNQIAAQFGLNFQNVGDQLAGAWYYAQQIFAGKTGGSLESALQNGQLSSVQSALAKVWPSVTGNAAAPNGLAYDIAHGKGISVTNPLARRSPEGFPPPGHSNPQASQASGQDRVGSPTLPAQSAASSQGSKSEPVSGRSKTRGWAERGSEAAPEQRGKGGLWTRLGLGRRSQAWKTGSQAASKPPKGSGSASPSEQSGLSSSLSGSSQSSGPTKTFGTPSQTPP